ncbi:hypothetical protein ACFQY7_55365 [Actinomadura luteofluorescens]|uniref:hypothetical protein n=1 Tax=Actinomadura luteofluorescens TaxID=46163 RepID=UPI00363F70C6
MSRLLYRLGRAAALRPWRFIVVWLVLVAAMAGLSGVAGEPCTTTTRWPGRARSRPPTC